MPEMTILGNVANSPFVLNYKEFASGNVGYSGKISFIMNDKMYTAFVNAVEQNENTKANSKAYQKKAYKPAFLKNKKIR
jgi:hypothetical protein